MTNLSLRLQSIFDLVEENSKVIHIGTDHALLEIALTKEKNVFCIGTDIKPYSIQKALHNIEVSGLKNKIFLLVSDGLKNVEVNGETLILAGLGTDTILKILENKKSNLASKIIIQSNNHLEKLRREMVKKGYQITYEEAIFDANYWYVILVFQKGFAYLTEEEYIFGKMITNVCYYRHLLKVEEDLLQKIPISEKNRREKVISKIHYLQEKIKK